MMRRIFRKIQDFLGSIRDRISEPNTAIPNSSCWTKRPVLHAGYTRKSLDDAINELEMALQKNGFLLTRNGQFDTTLEEAVKEFQMSHHLIPDGVVGPLTWAALLYPVLSKRSPKTPDNEEFIRELQTLLIEEKFKVKRDGHFGPRTDKALRKFQRKWGLYANGVCNPLTWVTLLGQRCEPKQPKKVFYILDGEDFEQFLMIGAILLGISFNPLGLDDDLSLFQTVLVAYVLTGFAPKVLDNVLNEYLVYPNFPLLKFSHYVLAGLLWRPFIQFVRVLILKH